MDDRLKMLLVIFALVIVAGVLIQQAYIDKKRSEEHEQD